MQRSERRQDYPDHYFTLGPFHSLFASGFPILSYHKIGHAPLAARRKGMFVTSNLLARQLGELKNANYQFESIEHPVGNRKVVISFDDGYVSCFREAMPVLDEMRCRAIQYLPVARLGKTNDWDPRQEPIMDKSQVREWLAAGHTIGSHSLTHPNLTRLDSQQAQKEIAESKIWLEDTFAIPIRHFAYPYGAWNERIAQLVGEAGYTTAVTTEFGVNDHRTNQYRFRRISAYGSLREVFFGLIKRLRR